VRERYFIPIPPQRQFLTLAQYMVESRGIPHGSVKGYGLIY
jgi:hypothetical protein